MTKEERVAEIIKDCEESQAMQTYIARNLLDLDVFADILYDLEVSNDEARKAFMPEEEWDNFEKNGPKMPTEVLQYATSFMKYTQTYDQAVYGMRTSCALMRAMGKKWNETGGVVTP